MSATVGGGYFAFLAFWAGFWAVTEIENAARQAWAAARSARREAKLVSSFAALRVALCTLVCAVAKGSCSTMYVEREAKVCDASVGWSDMYDITILPIEGTC